MMIALDHPGPNKLETTQVILPFLSSRGLHEVTCLKIVGRITQQLKGDDSEAPKQRLMRIVGGRLFENTV